MFWLDTRALTRPTFLQPRHRLTSTKSILHERPPRSCTQTALEFRWDLTALTHAVVGIADRRVFRTICYDYKADTKNLTWQECRHSRTLHFLAMAPRAAGKGLCSKFQCCSSSSMSYSVQGLQMCPLSCGRLSRIDKAKVYDGAVFFPVRRPRKS